MVIERTDKEVIIRLLADIYTSGLQQIIDYLSYQGATSKSQATQAQVDALANEVKKGWWEKNRENLTHQK